MIGEMDNCMRGNEKITKKKGVESILMKTNKVGAFI